VAADRTAAVIARIVNWHADRDDTYQPPRLKLKRRRKASEQQRARTLDDSELRALFKAAEAVGMFGKYVRLLVYTAARRNELALMQWPELQDGVFVLPASRNKAAARSPRAGALARPLSQEALAIFASLPKTGPYVFGGQKPLTGFTRPWRRLLKAMQAVLTEQDAAADLLPLPMQRLTIHDLRRSSASLMQRAGVPQGHISAALGHVIPGVDGVYLRHKHELTRAYQLLAAEIGRVLNPPPAKDNVVPLNKAGGE
jgi:integrase